MALDNLVLDYNAGQVFAPFDPVDDDQATRNDITVTRIGGTSARAEQTTGALSTAPPPAGVGRYDTGVDLSLHRDDQVADQAWWRLHLGTVDEPRFPTVPVNLIAAPELVATAMNVDCGDLISVLNLPIGLAVGAVRQVIRGYTETFTPDGGWELTYNAGPYAPYRIVELDDATYGRLDSDASTLSSSLTTTATTVSVAVAAGYALWTTTGTRPGDFPFSIVIGGEEMTVTAITGTSSPQTFTVTRSVNGVVKTHTTGAAVRLARPAYLGL